MIRPHSTLEYRDSCTRAHDNGYQFKNGLDANLKTGLKNGVRSSH